ncbi:MAG: entericidin A/B family lipoprotein [Oricola sp.]|nr:entericidin A/B family lipoprotein [Oricola sp.]
MIDGILSGADMRILALLLAFGLFLSACETIKGVGRDIENTGEAIDDALEE